MEARVQNLLSRKKEAALKALWAFVGSSSVSLPLQMDF